MKNSIFNFFGTCSIKTDLKLDELALIISNEILGSTPFIWGEHSIWEEIPSMYIPCNILGMFVVIGGYDGDEEFTIEINPYGDFSRYINSKKLNNLEMKIYLNFYLYHLLKFGLEKYSNILVISPDDSTL